MKSQTHIDALSSFAKPCLALLVGIFVLFGCASCDDDASGKAAVSSKAPSEKASTASGEDFEGTVSDKVLSDGSADNAATSGDPASDSTASDKSAGSTASDKSSSDSAASGNSASNGTDSDKSASSEAASEGAASDSDSAKSSDKSASSAASDKAASGAASDKAASGTASNGTASSSAASSSAASSKSVDEAVPDEELLVSLLGEEYAEKLLNGAKDNADRYWIAAHPEAFDLGDEEMQVKLLRLAADEDDAVKYVRDYPKRYGFDPEEHGDGFGPAKSDKSASSAAAADKDESYPKVKTGNTRAPHLYQWDQRWGYSVYSSSAFGLSGCGPTALSIAYQAITGKSDIDPFAMGELAYETGFMTLYDGTNGALFTELASQLGMDCEIIDATEDSLRDALERKCVVVDNMGNGTFSNYGGHFLVLTGLDGKGKVVMNDPYSAENSRKSWDIDFLLGETKVLYAFSKAGEGAKKADSSPESEEAASGEDGSEEPAGEEPEAEELELGESE